MLIRTLPALVLLALLVAACGGGESDAEPGARPTLTDPASVPTAIPDEDRAPYRLGPEGAQPPDPNAPSPVESGERTYTVQAGDTCGGIALTFGISVPALLTANPAINEDCTNLGLGADLTIPVSDSVEAASGGGGRGVYIVVTGDTCAAIAEDHGVTLQELFEASGLDEESCLTLQIGQEITVPR